jgi:hypothetical protein
VVNAGKLRNMIKYYGIFIVNLETSHASALFSETAW